MNTVVTTVATIHVESTGFVGRSDMGAVFSTT